jgi:hypothetical protein
MQERARSTVNRKQRAMARSDPKWPADLMPAHPYDPPAITNLPRCRRDCLWLAVTGPLAQRAAIAATA